MNHETMPSCCGSEATTSEGSCDTRATRTPAADIRETTARYTLEIEMPGVAKSDVEVHLEKSVLRVVGHVPEGSTSGDFVREFRIGDSVDSEGITADMADGILTLRLPKHGEAQARTIEVR